MGVFLHIFDIHVPIIIYIFTLSLLSVYHDEKNIFFYIYIHILSYKYIQCTWKFIARVIHGIWALFGNYLFLYMI